MPPMISAAVKLLAQRKLAPTGAPSMIGERHNEQ